MAVIAEDPASGIAYSRLPWKDIGVRLLAKPANRRTIAATHHALVSQASAAPTAAERLEALGIAVGEIFNGLDEDDGKRLGTEWRTLLADLASCGTHGVRGWAATFGESTANWWPPGSAPLTRGVVNAIVRSPTVEDLHTGDRVSYYDNQLGAMCANWAACSLLDPVLEPDPGTWGLTDSDVEHARQPRLYSVAASEFPAGWSVIESLGRCIDESTNNVGLDLPDAGTAEDARAWLIEHAGSTRKADIDSPVMPAHIERNDATVRHAWSAPHPEELDRFEATGAIATPSLTRLSRHPLHIAATLQWAVRTGVPVLTPNVYIEPRRVSYRIPPVAAPAIDSGPEDKQASHSESWTNAKGLSFAHAQALGVSHAKVGRNEPCPCGSGAKYKRCHGS